MLSIFKKEINSFFSSPVAYLVIGSFLTLCGLFLWVFKGDYNILNAGFADITPFFFIAPWLFLFLIPAITMKSFADEQNNGTIEILKTKPITDWQIILGKFLASLTLVSIAILPTFLYVYSVYKLGNPEGNIDLGSTLGSYAGLFLLASAYTSIGIFTSTLSNNQIVSFIVSICLTFLLFYGFDALGELFNQYVIKRIGLYQHYKSIGRGVIDTRDIIYFFSVTFFFLFTTKKKLSNE